MATTTTNPITQIPLKYSLLGSDGMVTQPWALWFQQFQISLPPTGSGYVVDGSLATTGATIIYQGNAANRGGTPRANSIYFADDTGEIFTVEGGSWQLQSPATVGDVLKSAFSSTTQLAIVNANPGTYGNGMSIPVITVDAKGRTVAVTTTPVIAPDPTFPGKPGDFLYKSGSLGGFGTNDLFNINTFTVSYKITFHQADATPILICSVPANTVVQSVEFIILTAFDGSPAVSVGIGSGYNDLMSTTDNNSSILSNWTTTPSVKYTTAEDIYVAVSAGGGTLGYGMIVITTAQI